MGRNQYSYPPEYRARMVELVRAGRTPEELGREFEPTAQSIRSWVYQANRDEGRRADGLTSTEREELGRLRRENRQLKREREILAKATAWFARETGSVPSGVAPNERIRSASSRPLAEQSGGEFTSAVSATRTRHARFQADAKPPEIRRRSFFRLQPL